MFTLPHQIELLSEGWMREARAFLAGERAKSGEPAPLSRVRGRPFSVSIRLSDAPPHMELAGDTAAGTIRFDGEAFTVGDIFAADADLVVEGDYQGAVTAAQMVGIAAPGAVAAVRSEVAHIYGPSALKLRGEIADVAVLGLLSALFDHLGRKTVENPDLAHRAARQGLSRHIREMEETGYTIVENAITPAFADEARAEIVRILATHGYTTMNWMLYHGRMLERLALNPRLMTLIDASLGRGAVIGSLSAIRRGPGRGFIPLHTDYSHIPDPYPAYAMTGVGVWAFEDWTEASGPTVLAPGTQRLRRSPRHGDDPGPGVPIIMPKGSVVFFTEGVWHWQGDRTEAGERITLHSHFNRGILRSLEAKKIDAQMIYRNPPRLGEMLGEDDWFEKTTADGRDQVRFAHMHRLLAFNERQKQAILAGAEAPEVSATAAEAVPA